MITYVKGSRYTFTKIGSFRKLSLTFTPRPLGYRLPETSTSTDMIYYGAYEFETHRKSSGGLNSRLCTRGPRGYL